MNTLPTFRALAVSRHLLALAVVFSSGTSSLHAQARVREERRPDVSDKALVTKEKPNPRKKLDAQGKSGGAVKQYTIEQFMATTQVGGASFSHDEKPILFHSNKTRHLQRLQHSGFGRRAEAADQLDEGKHLCRLRTSRTTRASSTPMTKAATRTPSLPARARRHRARPDAGREDEGQFPRLESRSQVVLLLDQRARPEVLRHLRDEHRRPEAGAALQGRNRLRVRRHLERQAIHRLPQERRRRPRFRHLSLQHRNEGDEEHHGAQRRCRQPAAGVRSGVEAPLLPLRRGRRVLDTSSATSLRPANARSWRRRTGTSRSPTFRATASIASWPQRRRAHEVKIYEHGDRQAGSSCRSCPMATSPA